MSSGTFGSVSTKNIMMEYLKLSNKTDMANAVELYCDEERGIVFNKHPASNEEKFGDIYEYAVSAAHIPPVSASTNDSLASLISSVKLSSNGVRTEFEKAFKNLNNSFDTNSEYEQGTSFLKKETKEILTKIQSEENDANKINHEEQSTKTQEHIPSTTTENLDHLYDIIAPEGRGKFQKFVGNDFVYVLLEDGTHHCYPFHLVKYNREYLKKKPLYTLNYNYKNLALKHTQNILKANKNFTSQMNHPISAQTKPSDEFIEFPENFSYLKDHIKCTDSTDNSHSRNYLIHLKTKQEIKKSDDAEEKYIDDPTCAPIKKNIHVSNVNNVYQIEKIENYKTIKEEVAEEKAVENFCCQL